MSGETPTVWVSPVTGQKSFDQNSGASLILNERARQVVVEGYDGTHDYGHEAELLEAARAYVAAADFEARHPEADLLPYPVDEDNGRHYFPWAPVYWKPTGDPVKTLVKAGALIAAAIDALQDRRVRESTEQERGR